MVVCGLKEPYSLFPLQVADAHPPETWEYDGDIDRYKQRLTLKSLPAERSVEEYGLKNIDNKKQ